jgi:hypothetical protein
MHLVVVSLNHLKTKRRLLYLRPSSYRAVNTFHLGYKNQSVYVVWGRSRCLFSGKESYPVTGPKAQRVGRGIALLFPDLGARRGWVVSTTPRPLYPWERPGTHCTGGWVGPRVGLDVCEKSRPPLGFDPRNVHLVVSRYTD